MKEKQKNIHTSQHTPYCGRFAPSPSGLLHFGSLVAAVGSFLHAKHQHGKWLVRIEDVDPPRIVPGSSDAILRTLETLGMEWDGAVIYQSQRCALYQDALATLDKQGLIYSCICSRKEILDSSMEGEYGPIYSGKCRNKSSKRKQGAQRICTNDNPIVFKDGLEGTVCQKLEQDVGDFVVRRADGVYTYQLAVVVDDFEQDITHIVRGFDLLSSTPRQIYLQQCLGYSSTDYIHLPLVTNHSGEKLSKQTKAAPIDLSNVLPELYSALNFLGQKPPAELLMGDIPSLWSWAITNWQISNVPVNNL